MWRVHGKFILLRQIAGSSPSTTHMQDPNIVSRLHRGDGAALKSLFRSNGQKAYALAFRMTGDTTAASEVVRAVFEELWHKRRDLDPLQEMTSTILRETYLCVRALQSERQLPTVTLHATVDPSLQPVIERLGGLTENQRLAFLLFASDGFSQRELARTLDVSDDAIATLLGKALQELEEVVQQTAL